MCILLLIKRGAFKEEGMFNNIKKLIVAIIITFFLGGCAVVSSPV